MKTNNITFLVISSSIDKRRSHLALLAWTAKGQIAWLIVLGDADNQTIGLGIETAGRTKVVKEDSEGLFHVESPSVVSDNKVPDIVGPEVRAFVDIRHRCGGTGVGVSAVNRLKNTANAESLFFVGLLLLLRAFPDRQVVKVLAKVKLGKDVEANIFGCVVVALGLARAFVAQRKANDAAVSFASDLPGRTNRQVLEVSDGLASEGQPAQIFGGKEVEETERRRNEDFENLFAGLRGRGVAHDVELRHAAALAGSKLAPLALASALTAQSLDGKRGIFADEDAPLVHLGFIEEVGELRNYGVGLEGGGALLLPASKASLVPMEKLLMETRELGVLFQEKLVSGFDAVVEEAFVARKVLAEEEASVSVAPLDQLLANFADFLVKVGDLEDDAFLVDFVNDDNFVFASFFDRMTDNAQVAAAGREGVRSALEGTRGVLGTTTHGRRRGTAGASKVGALHRALVAGVHRDNTTSRPGGGLETRGLRGPTKGVATVVRVQTRHVHHDGRAERREITRKTLGHGDGHGGSLLRTVLRRGAERGV